MLIDLYGPSGTGKTTAAATFPQPGLTLFLDNPGQEKPYKDLGVKTVRGVMNMGGTEYFYDDVFDAEGMLIWRVEFLKSIASSQVIKQRIEALTVVQPEQWRTTVIDGSTSLEILARHDFKFNLNPGVKDGRQAYAYSTDYLETLIWMILGTLPVDYVMMLSHISTSNIEINFEALKVPAFPGRLGISGPGAFSEVWRTYSQDDKEGNKQYMLQTQVGNGCTAKSMLGAPNPSWPDWKWIEGETRGEGEKRK